MINEMEDRWVLGIRDARVVAVSRATELAIDLDIGVEIRVSGNALLTVGPATSPDAVPRRVSDVSIEVLKELVGASVLSAVVFKSGSLRIVFSSTIHLTVRSQDHNVCAEVRKPGYFEWSYRNAVAAMRMIE